MKVGGIDLCSIRTCARAAYVLLLIMCVHAHVQLHIREYGIDLRNRCFSFIHKQRI